MAAIQLAAMRRAIIKRYKQGKQEGRVKGMVVKIQNNDMAEVEKSELAVVDFSATWCGPCKMLAPVFHELAEEMGEIDFFNADVDENRELAEKYGIQGVPSVLVFKKGVQADRSVGFQAKEKLRQFIEAQKN